MVGTTGEAILTASKIAAIGLVFGVATALILGQWIEGSLSGTEVVTYVFVTLAAVVAAINFYDKPLLFVVFAVALAIAGAMWGAKLLGQNLAKRRLDDQEISQYNDAIVRDPNNAGAYSYLGDVYIRTSRYNDAISAYQKATELMPHSRQDRFKLCHAKKEKHRIEMNGAHCATCNAINRRHSPYCAACGCLLHRPYLVDLGDWLRKPESYQRLLITTGIVTATIFVISLLIKLAS